MKKFLIIIFSLIVLAILGFFVYKIYFNKQILENNSNTETSSSTKEEILNTDSISSTTNQNNLSTNTNTIKKHMTLATIYTNLGNIILELNQYTPITTKNFTDLAKKNFYDGVRFHRVIKGFVIQAGDPQSKNVSLKSKWGTGGPGYSFEDEIQGDEKYSLGTLAMANSGKDTNGSQFFIVSSPDVNLPPNYTVFGKVVKGIEVVEKIQNVKTGLGDVPVEDVIISKIEIEEKN